MIDADLILSTSKVILKPLHTDDFLALCELTSSDADKNLWEYFTYNLADEKQLTDWLTIAFKEKAMETRMPFIIIEKETGLIAGSSSIGNISYYDKRADIGWSWLGQKFRGTDINRHAKFAMLHYAFDIADFERIEFKTGVHNERAKNGLLKIGAIQEGVLRSHTQLWNGNRRTSVVYSILKNEWAVLKTTIFKDLL